MIMLETHIKCRVDQFFPPVRRFGDRSHTETTVRRPDGTEERTVSGSEDFERAWAERGPITRQATSELMQPFTLQAC